MDLRRARALSSELEYFLLLAHDLGHLDDASYERFSGDTVEIQKMLSGLLRKL
jgi:four helix bundle protein